MSVDITIANVRNVTAVPMPTGVKWVLQIDGPGISVDVIMTEAQAKAMAAAFDEPKSPWLVMRQHLDADLREALDQIMILVDRGTMEREDIMGAADELSKVAQRIFAEAEGC